MADKERPTSPPSPFSAKTWGRVIKNAKAGKLQVQMGFKSSG